MINHELRCIFIHIPRTAGTSIERWLCGNNWWNIEPATKHLTARQAKALYAEYWDDYFKFSIVRHPMRRVESMMRYGRFYGLAQQPDGAIDFAGYKNKFGAQVVVEFDYRFYKRADVAHDGHLPGQIYGNILDAELDFIARFENLEADLAQISRQIGIKTKMKSHAEPSLGPKPDSSHPVTKAAILALYDRDFTRFGYSDTPDA